MIEARGSSTGPSTRTGGVDLLSRLALVILLGGGGGARVTSPADRESSGRFASKGQGVGLESKRGSAPPTIMFKRNKRLTDYAACAG